MCTVPDGLDAVGLAVVVLAVIYISVYVTAQCSAEDRARNPNR